MGFAHPLAAWLEARSLGRSVFADQIGISESFLSQVLSRKRRPSLEVAVKIERATDGQVPASALLIGEEGAA